jgi:hypothetical protein
MAVVANETEEQLLGGGFGGARESGYDCGADDHSDKGEGDKQIMHLGGSPLWSSLELCPLFKSA